MNKSDIFDMIKFVLAAIFIINIGTILIVTNSAFLIWAFCKIFS